MSETEKIEVEYIGPFEYHAVVVDGWRVPFLEATPERGGRLLLSLDGRQGLELDLATAERVVPFLADAIAVASGFSCHPRQGWEGPVSLPVAAPRRMSRLDILSDAGVDE